MPLTEQQKRNFKMLAKKLLGGQVGDLSADDDYKALQQALDYLIYQDETGRNLMDYAIDGNTDGLRNSAVIAALIQVGAKRTPPPEYELPPSAPPLENESEQNNPSENTETMESLINALEKDPQYLENMNDYQIYSMFKPLFNPLIEILKSNGFKDKPDIPYKAIEAVENRLNKISFLIEEVKRLQAQRYHRLEVRLLDFSQNRRNIHDNSQKYLLEYEKIDYDTHRGLEEIIKRDEYFQYYCLLEACNRVKDAEIIEKLIELGASRKSLVYADQRNVLQLILSRSDLTEEQKIEFISAILKNATNEEMSFFLKHVDKSYRSFVDLIMMTDETGALLKASLQFFDPCQFSMHCIFNDSREVYQWVTGDHTNTHNNKGYDKHHKIWLNNHAILFTSILTHLGTQTNEMKLSVIRGALTKFNPNKEMALQFAKRLAGINIDAKTMNEILRSCIANGHYEVIEEILTHMPIENKLEHLRVAIDHYDTIMTAFFLREIGEEYFRDLRENALKPESARNKGDYIIYQKLFEKTDIGQLYNLHKAGSSLANVRAREDMISTFWLVCRYCMEPKETYEGSRPHKNKELMKVAWKTGISLNGIDYDTPKPLIDKITERPDPNLIGQYIPELRQNRPTLVRLAEFVGIPPEPEGDVTTPLIATIRRGKFQAAARLLRYGADPTLPDPVNGNTALHEAVLAMIKNPEHDYIQIIFQAGFFDKRFLEMENNNEKTALQLLQTANFQNENLKNNLIRRLQVGSAVVASGTAAKMTPSYSEASSSSSSVTMKPVQQAEMLLDELQQEIQDGDMGLSALFDETPKTEKPVQQAEAPPAVKPLPPAVAPPIPEPTPGAPPLTDKPLEPKAPVINDDDDRKKEVEMLLNELEQEIQDGDMGLEALFSQLDPIPTKNPGDNQEIAVEDEDDDEKRLTEAEKEEQRKRKGKTRVKENPSSN